MVLGWLMPVGLTAVTAHGGVDENYCLENDVVKAFVQQVEYPNDDYTFTKITDYSSQVTSFRKDQPQPVRINVPATDEGKCLILETCHDGKIVRSDTFCIGQRNLEVWNLIPNTHYTYHLFTLGFDGTSKNDVADGDFTTEGQVRMMKIDDIVNVRDIGGWPIQHGGFVKYDKIFRSAELGKTSRIITSEGIRELLAVQGIGVEIDFGGYSGESPVEDLLDFVHGPDYQIVQYAVGIRENGLQYRNCFEKVVNSLREGKKILFHCNAGADRAGTFAFLLEGLLGVSESDLAKDYELSGLVYEGWNRTAESRASGGGYNGLVEYVKSTFRGHTINEKIEQMALGFGISQKDIDDFRALMTDGVEEKPDDIIDKGKVSTVLDKANAHQFVAKFSSDTYNVIFNADDVKLYSVYVDGETAYFQACRTRNGKYFVAADEHVILKTDAAAEVNFTIDSYVGGGWEDADGGNCLGFDDVECLYKDGELADIQALLGMGGGDYLYRLTNTASQGFGFTSYTGKDIKANQFFVKCTKKPADAARLNVVWLDEDGNVEDATAIQGVKKITEANDGAIYNLQGVRVNKAQKGINIQNGKKFVVK